MSLQLQALGVAVDKRYAELPYNTPVIAQSSTSGMCWEIGSVQEAKVTEEMVVMGCELPVGTRIVLITID